jgi:hypothetical protein
MIHDKSEFVRLSFELLGLRGLGEISRIGLSILSDLGTVGFGFSH